MHSAVQRVIDDATDRPGFSGRVVLTTMFGDAVLPRSQEIAVQDLAALASPLGLNERLVRTSLLRLTRENLVIAERRGRKSFYRVHPDAIPVFEDANRRIYGRDESAEAWDGEWTIGILDSGVDRQLRQRAVTELSWIGVRAISTDVVASPTVEPKNISLVCDRLDVGLAALMRGPLLDGTVGADANRARHLDPDGRLAALLQAHKARFEPLAPLAAGLDPDAAFIARTLLIDSWRRIALATPLFPGELLPGDWLGDDMHALTKQLHGDLYDASERHLDAHIGPTTAESLFTTTS